MLRRFELAVTGALLSVSVQAGDLVSLTDCTTGRPLWVDASLVTAIVPQQQGGCQTVFLRGAGKLPGVQVKGDPEDLAKRLRKGR